MFYSELDDKTLTSELGGTSLRFLGGQPQDIGTVEEFQNQIVCHHSWLEQVHREAASVLREIERGDAWQTPASMKSFRICRGFK